MCRNRTYKKRERKDKERADQEEKERVETERKRKEGADEESIRTEQTDQSEIIGNRQSIVPPVTNLDPVEEKPSGIKTKKKRTDKCLYESIL